MPQLKSGRQFVLSLSPYLDRLKSGSSEQIYLAVLHCRLNVRTSRDLLQFATIGYFDQNSAGPPAGETYSSSFLVHDLGAGKTDWLPEEIEEFNLWVDSNPALDQWLTEHCTKVDMVIKNSPLWASDLILGD